jgi:hypothetical protein
MSEAKSPLASASSMWRHANCHGNRILERSLRDRGLLGHEDTTPEATIGTRIHASLEGMPEDLELTEEDVKDRCESLDEECRKAFNQGKPDWTQYEARYDWWEEPNPDIKFFTGKPDRIHFYQGNRYALDINFKTGRKGSPESHLNLQLRTEIVLIWRHYRCEWIGGAIVEPLVSSKPEIVIYDESALREAEREILEIVDKTEWDSSRKAGGWCIHCPCRAFCPEAKQLALHEPLYIFTKGLPRGEEGAEVLAKIEVAKAILDKMHDAYKNIVQTELNSIPGWHISDSTSVRFIKDIPRAEDIAAKKLDIGIHDLVKTTLPIGKLEARVAEATGLKGKALKAKIKDLFELVIGTTEKAGSLERIPKRLL